MAKRAEYAAAAKKKAKRQAIVKRSAQVAAVAAIGVAGVYAGRRSTGSKLAAQVGSSPAQARSVAQPVSGGTKRPGKVNFSAPVGKLKLAQPSGKSFQAGNAQLPGKAKIPNATNLKIATFGPTGIKAAPVQNPSPAPTEQAKIKNSIPKTSTRATPKTTRKRATTGASEPVANPRVVSKADGSYAKANAEMTARMKASGIQIGAGVGRMNNNGVFIKPAKETAGRRIGNKADEAFLHGGMTQKAAKKRESMSAAIRKEIAGAKLTRRERAENRYADILVNARESGQRLSPSQRKWLKELGL